MSESMVERVARALAEASLDREELPISAALLRVAYVPLARGAIAALREPTSEMCAAGADSADDLSHMGAQTVWHAMCDAALSEQSSG